MNVELYFNDQLADFDNEDTIAGTYAINKLGELKSRQGYYTNTYNLPLSHRNKKIFQNAELVNNASTVPYSLLTHRVVIEGVEVFNGVAKIETAKNVYEVTGFAGNADFFNLIRDKSIRDLDLSEWDHVRDDATIAASWANTEGYNYAFLDYGKYGEVASIDPKDLYPSVFFKTIIEQIAADAGYELTGRVLNNERFKSMLVPWSGDKTDRDTEDHFFSGHLDVLNLPPTTVNVIAVLTEDSDVRNVYDTSLGFYTAEFDCHATVHLHHTFITDRGAGYQIVKRKYNNPSNDPTPGGTDEVIAFGAGSGDGVSGEVNEDVDLLQGDRLFVKYNNIGTFAGVAVRVDEFSVQVEEFTDVYGLPWDVAENLPDIGQDKFFLEFMVQFGLIPFPDVENGVIDLVHFNDIEKNEPVDWSRKLDDSEEPEVTFRFENYKQRNKLTYRTEEPDPNRDNTNLLTDGFDYEFLISDTTLEVEGTEFESSFYLPPVGSTMSGAASTLLPKIYSIDESANDFPVFEGKWDATSSYTGGRSVVFHTAKTWRAVNDNTNSAPTSSNSNWDLVQENAIWQITPREIIGRLETGLPVAVMFETGQMNCSMFVRATGMTWPEIYDDHYQLFAVVIDNTKIVKQLIKLNYADINQLDLTRPIYIDRYGCNFYCDIVEQFKFNETDSTYVTLIRI